MFVDLTGKKYNRLLVLGQEGLYISPKGKKHCKWKCLCDCGKITVVLTSKIKKGFTKSCGCFKNENLDHKTNNQHHGWKGYKDLSMSIWSRMKNSAKARNIEFLISIEEAYSLLERQEFKCALTGEPIYIAQTAREWTTYGVNTASLDRIDSEKPYRLDNVQWLHVKVNYMKQWYPQDEFIDWCSKVAKFNRAL